MAKNKGRTTPPHQPVLPDRPSTLPSDHDTMKISVLLDAQARKMFSECQRLLYAQEPLRFPSVSRVMRVALATLYHSLTGQVEPSQGK